MGSSCSRLNKSSMVHEPSDNSVSTTAATSPASALREDHRFRFSLNASGREMPSRPLPVQPMDLKPFTATPQQSNLLPPRSPSLAAVKIKHDPQRRELAPQRPFSVEDSRSSISLLSDGGNPHRQDTSLPFVGHRPFVGVSPTAVGTSGTMSMDAFYQPSTPPAQDAFDGSGTVSTARLSSRDDHLRHREEPPAVGHDHSLLSDSDNRPDGTGWSSSSNCGEVSPASRLQLPTFTATSANRGRMFF